MDRETERDIWMMHDRRMGEMDNKIHDAQNSIGAVVQELKQVLDRINMGISPTMQKVLEKQGDINLTLEKLDHKVELSINQMKNQFDAAMASISNTVEAQVSPVVVEHNGIKRDVDWLKSSVYGTILLLVIGIVTIGGIAAYKYVFNTPSVNQLRHQRNNE
jgi:hypothetical protein